MKRLIRWSAFLALIVLLVKTVGAVKMLKNRTAKTQGVFSQLRSSKEKEDKSANQD